MKGKMISMRLVPSLITMAVIAIFIVVICQAYGEIGTTEKLEKKISKLKVEAEAQEIEIANLKVKLNNCPGNLEAAKLENKRLTGELEAAADNLKKLEASTKSLIVPVRKIINLCGAVGNMCMIDKAKLLEHINSLRVHVAPGE